MAIEKKLLLLGGVIPIGKVFFPVSGPELGFSGKRVGKGEVTEEEDGAKT